MNANCMHSVRSMLDKEDERALRRYNCTDLELREFAASRFEKLVQQQQSAWQGELAEFRRANAEVIDCAQWEPTV